MPARVIVPPDPIVSLMTERACNITRAAGVTRDLVARALIEAWTEGVNAGFDTDDLSHEILPWKPNT